MNHFWRVLQMAGVLAAPLAALAVCLAPAPYLCWLVGQYVSLDWGDALTELPWCGVAGVSQFQIHAPLWGLVWVPAMALLGGVAGHHVRLHWAWRWVGAVVGGALYALLVLYFYWLAGRS